MCPRLEMNLLSAGKNESVDSSPTNSIWALLIVRCVSKTPYRLARPVVGLVSFTPFDEVWPNVIHTCVSGRFTSTFFFLYIYIYKYDLHVKHK